MLALTLNFGAFVQQYFSFREEKNLLVKALGFFGKKINII